MRVILLTLLFAAPAIAQSEDHGELIQELAMKRALLSRMTIWTMRDGKPVYIGHCRGATNGCEHRISEYVMDFLAAAREYNVDPWILAAIAVRESGLNPQAVGSVGETGLFQFHPHGAAGRRARRACRYHENTCTAECARIAAQSLAQYITRCGNLEQAITHYNRGVCGESVYARSVMQERLRLLEAVR